MRTLTYRYSILYDDLERLLRLELDDWLRHELVRGGLNEIQVAHKVTELVAGHVPSSPHQLLELALQCEEVLGVDLVETFADWRPEDAYDALRASVLRHFTDALVSQWHGVRDEEATPADEFFRSDDEDYVDGDGRPPRPDS